MEEADSNEKIKISDENIDTPEIPRNNWQTLIFLQRHGRYDNSMPENPDHPTDDEKARLGHLTLQGRLETAKITKDRIKAIFDQVNPSRVDFLILNSPTFWLDDTSLGQRARETAEIVFDNLIQQLAENDRPASQLLNTQEAKSRDEDKLPRRDNRFKGDAVSRPEIKLQESQMFQFPNYVNFMREKYKGQGPDFWDARSSEANPEDLLKRVAEGAPGPIDDAKEISDTVVAAQRFARAYHNDQLHPENKGRRLVVWMISHGDGTQPYAQRVIGAPSEDFKGGYNEGFGITIDKDNNAEAQIKGKSYPLKFPSGGRDVHVRTNDEING